MLVETNKTSLVPSHLFFDKPGETKRLDASMLTNQAVLSEKSCLGIFLGRSTYCMLGLV